MWALVIGGLACLFTAGGFGLAATRIRRDDD
jgi:hypothetical protein